MISNDFEAVRDNLLAKARRPVHPDDLEAELRSLLGTVHASHIGVYREDTPFVNSRIALSATLFREKGERAGRWFFQDVHRGGAAAAAGIHPGDELLQVNGTTIPDNGPLFQLGAKSLLLIRDREDREQMITVDVPAGKSRSHPVVVPQAVEARMIADQVGLLKVTMFPGLIGIDVARDISTAVESLGCKKLIIDLRGNTGGGLGCIRLMSLLTPERLRMGYSLSRSALSRGVDPQTLPVIDNIPASKLGLVQLLVRFGWRDKSVAIGSEGLGVNPFLRRTVLLVNEHTASSAEMVAAFASENRLCQLVGTRTAGRLVGARSFKIGGGFRVALPVVAFRTWAGQTLEGAGIEPDRRADFNVEASRRGTDQPMLRAVDVVSSL